jgi:hypothetical protein
MLLFLLVYNGIFEIKIRKSISISYKINQTSQSLINEKESWYDFFNLAS